MRGHGGNDSLICSFADSSILCVVNGLICLRTPNACDRNANCHLSFKNRLNFWNIPWMTLLSPNRMVAHAPTLSSLHSRMEWALIGPIP
jgi:hypothetical protein